MGMANTIRVPLLCCPEVDSSASSSSHSIFAALAASERGDAADLRSDVAAGFGVVKWVKCWFDSGCVRFSLGLGVGPVFQVWEFEATLGRWSLFQPANSDDKDTFPELVPSAVFLGRDFGN